MNRIDDRSSRARARLPALVGLAILALLLSLLYLPTGEMPWLTLVIVGICAAGAQSLGGRPTDDDSSRLTLVFVVAGALLLPAPLIGLSIVLAYSLDVLLHGRSLAALYARAAGASSTLIAGLIARAAFVLFHGGDSLADPATLVAAAIAALAYTAAKLLLLVVVGDFPPVGGSREAARRLRARLITDLALGCLGITVALLWQQSPALVTLIAAPLFLVQRALTTPALERLARTDPKTGLFNARHFSQVLGEEIRRSARFGRPLTVVMADLDLLRNVNNAYGHLAGDAVLVGVADVIRSCLREYDIAARFGGEEFVILLPECDAERGLVVAERIRGRVADARFHSPHAPAPIPVTLSLGVAAYPAHGRTPEEVIHQADLAVYQAKLSGRNRVRAADAESAALGLAAGIRIPRGLEPDESVERPTPRGLAQWPGATDPGTPPEPAAVRRTPLDAEGAVDWRQQARSSPTSLFG